MRFPDYLDCLSKYFNLPVKQIRQDFHALKNLKRIYWQKIETDRRNITYETKSSGGSGEACKISHSESGLQCQSWFSQFPNQHNERVESNNFCRYSESSLEFGCYTTKGWEKCNIPTCKGKACSFC